MEITEKLKKRHFNVYEKESLYSTISQDASKKVHEFEDLLRSYITDIIKEYVLTEGSDIEYLSKKSYVEKITTFSIAPSELDLPCNYPLDMSKMPSYDAEVPMGFCMDFSEYIGIPYQKQKIGPTKFNIIKLLAENCPPEIIEVLRDKVIELGKLRYEDKNYMSKEVIGENNPYRKPFNNVNTWGQLYNKNKDWFNIVYDKFKNRLTKEELGKDPSESEKERIKHELSDKIKDLRASFGFK